MVLETDVKVCDGHLLKWLIAAGVAWLEHNMDQVNNMNVFPVPDGDTGTNMFHTMERAYREIAKMDEDNVGVVSASVARGALMGARGNSGTILSQIFRGFAEGLKGLEAFNSRQLAGAIQLAVDYAYKSVTDPKEGTILTVARETAEKINAVVESEFDLHVLLDEMVNAAYESLKKTPDLLPVLKEAGVMDSGGMGLVYLLEGMQRLAKGQPVDYRVGSEHAIDVRVNGAHWQEALIPEDEEGYGYDVQFLMVGDKLDVDRVRDDINAMGWSTVVVGDESMIKVHVHVHNPGEPLSYAIQSGAELNDIVVENMQFQYREYVQHRVERESQGPKDIDGVAIIAVVNGGGLQKMFNELDVAHCIAGGQTMNPSTEDFMRAIESLPNDEIIILPNNKNIILAAEQAASLSRDKVVRVLKTVTIPQGINALIAYGDVRENGSIDDIYDAMYDAMGSIVSGEITCATRSVEMNGVHVEAGQYIGLVNGKLLIAGNDIESVVIAMLDKAHVQKYELVTLYYGSEVTANQASELVTKLEARFDSIEFDLVQGAQPLYPYLIGME